MSLQQKIKRVEKGRAPTLLNTQKANEVIDDVNALKNIKITRGASYDSVHIGADGITLSLQEIPEQSGSDINADEVEFFVCIDGSAVKRTFYVKSSSS